MTKSTVSMAHVAHAHEVFTNETAVLLNLARDEVRSVRAATPALIGHWAVSVLGGDERISAIFAGDEERWATNANAIPLFAGDSAIDDTQAYDFRQGALAQKVNNLYEGRSAAQKDRFTRFSKLAAKFTFTVGASMGPTLGDLLPQVPQTAIRPSQAGEPQLYFPDKSDFNYTVGSSALLDRVVTFGPGLSGAIFGTNLAGLAKQVDFVSGGKGADFVTSIIDLGMKSSAVGIESFRRSGRLNEMLAKIGKDDIQMPRAEYHKKGIAKSRTRLKQGSAIDLAVMSSVHSAGVDECAAGIKISADNMKDGGTFILKAPEISQDDNEAGMDRVMPLAMQAFGSPAVAGECGQLQYAIPGEKPLERAASFAIFVK